MSWGCPYQITVIVWRGSFGFADAVPGEVLGVVDVGLAVPGEVDVPEGAIVPGEALGVVAVGLAVPDVADEPD
jgi:hypothetical protein